MINDKSNKKNNVFVIQPLQYLPLCSSAKLFSPCENNPPPPYRPREQGEIYTRCHNIVTPCPEMEFLDIILTKDLSLLLNAIHNPFYWRI
jgi:hypothetical protein